MAMEIVANTPPSERVPPANAPVVASGNGKGGARWIDVNLSSQSVYAYEGDTVVNSFVVSTGTWRTPTVTGQYKIWIKLRSGNMSGPGYFLPSVPYIMYFYKGYGLHGTYWHNNFGTPMSHGCVNLRTSDAEWLYNWASVGTVVNVHY
jgi:lipoprotein-anchoring transpeptidase ErfK/SrfK